MEPAEEQFQFFQQVEKMKKVDGPAMLYVTEEQAELLLAVWTQTGFSSDANLET